MYIDASERTSRGLAFISFSSYPVTFRQRSAGHSKLPSEYVWEYSNQTNPFLQKPAYRRAVMVNDEAVSDDAKVILIQADTPTVHSPPS